MDEQESIALQEKEFTAYQRQLLRACRRLRTLLESGEIEEAKVIIDQLIEDTETDIQA